MTRRRAGMIVRETVWEDPKELQDILVKLRSFYKRVQRAHAWRVSVGRDYTHFSAFYPSVSWARKTGYVSAVALGAI